MDITAYSKARPMAVKLALILLAFDCSVALVMDVINIQLSHYVIFGSWLIEDVLFLFFFCALFMGKIGLGGLSPFG
jgi:hypothetical protein